MASAAPIVQQAVARPAAASNLTRRASLNAAQALLDYMARGAPAELEAPPLSKTAQARLDYEKQKSRLQRIAEKVGHKIPYTLALIGTTMVAGSILQYLLSGEGPKELKDYFFPRTGRMTKYGTPERISLPSYMKDIYEYSTQPATTVINKANPIFGIIHAIWANEDFFGDPVRMAGPYVASYDREPYIAAVRAFLERG